MSVVMTSNAREVALDLGKVGYTATRRLQAIVPEAAKDVRDLWRSNAEESSHGYSVHYREAIEARPRGTLTQVVAPWEGDQSNMNFEFGTRQTAPHLDGQRAIDSLQLSIQRRFSLALVF